MGTFKAPCHSNLFWAPGPGSNGRRLVAAVNSGKRAPRLGQWNGRPKTARTNGNCKQGVDLKVWFDVQSSTCRKHKNGHGKRCFKLEVAQQGFFFL